MTLEERKDVIQKLDRLFHKQEHTFDEIMMKMKEEIIEEDFFEDLYEILYQFIYDEQKLLARVIKLMNQTKAEN